MCVSVCVCVLVLGSPVDHHRTIQLQLLQHYWWGIDLDYCDIEWFTLEMNRDHSVLFQIEPKYYLSGSLLNMSATPFIIIDFCPS